MDKATQTMIENLYKNTGKSLEEWIKLLLAQGDLKHGEQIKFLKENHGISHGFANLIAHKAKGSDAESNEDKDDLIISQYKGKEHFRPIYDYLISKISELGKDIEIMPKNTYVSIRRKKQFVILNPATKTRFEIGINLKTQAAEGKLVAEKPNSMCSHKISIGSLNDIDEEVLSWIEKAYQNAG